MILGLYYIEILSFYMTFDYIYLQALDANKQKIHFLMAFKFQCKCFVNLVKKKGSDLTFPGYRKLQSF